MKRRWTRADFEHIAKLKEQGVSWSAIGERIGVSRKEAQIHYWRYRTGAVRFLAEKWEAQREAIVARYFNGETIAQIARDDGVTWHAVHRRLNRAGLDAEARQEIREGKWA
jgi:DNA invertase Pin-like site-specific DNA recombinase